MSYTLDIPPVDWLPLLRLAVRLGVEPIPEGETRAIVVHVDNGPNIDPIEVAHAFLDRMDRELQ